MFLYFYEPNFTTNGIRNFMTQQKQRKQPILIDGKNIFTYCFQPIQPLQPNFTTCTTQCYQSYIANNKPNTKFLLIQLRQRKFCSIHIQVSTNFKIFIFKQFRTFHPSPICTFHRSRKTCAWLYKQFHTFHPSLHESVGQGVSKYLLPNSFLRFKSKSINDKV